MNCRKLLPLLFAFLVAAFAAQAQPGFQVDIKKDKPFTERKLKAEKTGEGKIKTPKRIFQNLTTRFNYFFNANNKFNEILERAKEQHRDDYAQLLTFYPYTLEAVAADSVQLDSVIFKCRSGIVNHDLRSEWADELYLLWAASWHMQKKLDSASMMLQFINYAFAPQEDYGFYSYIGSRKDGAQELSIVTPEKKQFLHSNTFSRNNAFIWQIRTLTELNETASAGSLITTLKRDPVFPKRLRTNLHEAEAYWYYKQGRWDSAAAHLILALDGAETKREKARWEYLIAQMLERSGNTAEAAAHYAEAVSSTPDPVMEVYGRLNLVRINKDGGENAVDKNVAELLKMAKRDKYEEYRDIIYYMTAQMEMERGNIAAAQELLAKGAKYNNGNQAARSKAFLQMADYAYTQKKYVQAAAFYDSIQVGDLRQEDAERVFRRKPALQQIVENTGVVSRQDSLQRIAALPKEERDELLKKMVKQLRKEQGLKEEAAPTAGSSLAGSPAPDLFSSAGKGEWYFYNTSSRTQGANEFKQVWGNRPNVDNWRRFAVVSQQLLNRNAANAKDPKGQNGSATAGADAADLTVEGLTSKLPLTPEAVNASGDSIKTALLALGHTFLDDLEDYPSAIAAFEDYRRRFPSGEKTDDALFNLYYAYTKAGNATQAAAVKKLLLEKYPASRYAAILSTGKDPQDATAANAEATKAYENVYNLFIEGRFAEAIAAKAQADSVYKTSFWQPQLLYIQAVYYIKQREDSVAKNSLQTIIRQNTNQALTAKAQNLLSVVSRRQQIEDELNRYQLQNTSDTASTASIDTAAKRTPATVVAPPPVVKTPVDTVAKKPSAKQIADSLARLASEAKKDSLAKARMLKATTDSLARVQRQKAKADSLARLQLSKAVRDSLNKVDRENLARERAAAKATKDSLAKASRDSLAREKAAAQAVKDSLARVAKRKPNPDTVARKTPQAPPKPASIYSFTPDAPHAAVVVLDKVDPVFVNEAKNAFFRYNREKYSSLPLDAQIVPLTGDVKLLLISGFGNAQAATDYAQRARTLAPTEIIPWLTGNKYTFTVISAANLDVLKGTTNLAEYKKFLEQYLPGKF